MATGDPDDLQGRIYGQLPPWFPDEGAPDLEQAMAGGGTILSWIYDLIAFAKLQMRLLTQSGGFLDLTAYEFFGTRFRRRPGELDDPWRFRIQAEIFRARQTRAAIDQALFDLTGSHPVINEPWNPADCGAYGIGTLGYGGGKPGSAAIGGYGIPRGGYGQGSDVYVVPTGDEGGSSPGAGMYGSLSFPKQIFITAYRPIGSGIPNLNGYGGGNGGYGVGVIAYADIGETQGAITDADIYATIAATTAAGITPWTEIV